VQSRESIKRLLSNQRYTVWVDVSLNQIIMEYIFKLLSVVQIRMGSAFESFETILSMVGWMRFEEGSGLSWNHFHQIHWYLYLDHPSLAEDESQYLMRMNWRLFVNKNFYLNQHSNYHHSLPWNSEMHY
jgi:hypothetical protein